MTHEQKATRGSLPFLSAAAEQFSRPRGIAEVRPHGSGNVHATFLVTCKGGDEQRFILQRVNTHVFRQPKLVMRNMRVVQDHILTRLQRETSPEGHRWEMPRVLLTDDGRDHWIDPDGSFWRGLSFIEAAQPFDTIQSQAHGNEVGYALGLFHSLISDLAVEDLADTLPGFHIMPRYLAHLDAVLAASPPSTPEVTYALSFVNQRRAFAGTLESARAEGRLVLRPIHGDPKVNNILIDRFSGRAVSLIDLDTVKPGLIHYDLGDCLRSCCNPLGEETEHWQAVRFDPDLCRVILQGYLGQAKRFLTGSDDEYLYDAIRLIAFELGIRFFTDYLEGNEYFRARYPEHNLARALVQFKLTESVEQQETIIRKIIDELR